MTASDASRSPVALVLDAVRHAFHLLAVGAARLWHATGAVAEMLSDAGHGPPRWRENSDIPNPYAGSGLGPVPADESRPKD